MEFIVKPKEKSIVFLNKLIADDVEIMKEHFKLDKE
mgnify:CR=1 FL=1